MGAMLSGKTAGYIKVRRLVKLGHLAISVFLFALCAIAGAMAVGWGTVASPRLQILCWGIYAAILVSLLFGLVRTIQRGSLLWSTVLCAAPFPFGFLLMLATLALAK